MSKKNEDTRMPMGKLWCSGRDSTYVLLLVTLSPKQKIILTPSRGLVNVHALVHTAVQVEHNLYPPPSPSDYWRGKREMRDIMHACE